jgi:hypothetical protein
VPAPGLVGALRPAREVPAPASSPPKPKTDLPEEIRRLPIELFADERGRISRVEIGEHIFSDLRALSDWVREIQADPETPFDEARLVVGPRLAFSEFVQVVDLLAACKVGAIGFELGKEADLP